MAKEIWTYSGGVWKKPLNLFVQDATGQQRLLQEMYVYRDGAWDLLVDFPGPPIVTSSRWSSASLSLLKASLGISPQYEYWNAVVNGRRVGDIDNNGTIQSADGNLMLTYSLSPSSLTQSQRDWIESVVTLYGNQSYDQYTNWGWP